MPQSRQLRYYYRNRERISAEQRAMRCNNPEYKVKRSESHKQWTINNIDHLRQYQLNRYLYKVSEGQFKDKYVVQHKDGTAKYYHTKKIMQKELGLSYYKITEAIEDGTEIQGMTIDQNW